MTESGLSSMILFLWCIGYSRFFLLSHHNVLLHASITTEFQRKTGLLLCIPTDHERENEGALETAQLRGVRAVWAVRSPGTGNILPNQTRLD